MIRLPSFIRRRLGSSNQKEDDSSQKRDKDDEESNNNNSNKYDRKENKKERKKRGSDDDEDDDDEEPQQDLKMNSTIYAKTIDDLPEDLKKKIRKCKLDPQLVNEHFEILCNVLRFTTKRQVVWDTEGRDDRPKPEKHDSSESNLPSSMLKNSESTISYTNPKKMFKKAEFKGKGGFGRVFYAKTAAGKVAIKKMPHHTPKEKRMNIDEIAVLNFCNHPNIVQYKHSYIYDDEVAVVMEYLEGGSLSEAVKKFTFSEAHIAFIAREMLKGIQYLHQNNIVHRDLKSGNVMLSTRGELKLIDFGLAVEISKCRVHMVGSPFWMPPEMIQCKHHGFAADVWSFAICLIEMADKKPPNRKARIRAMFISGTEGLIPYVNAQSHYSDQFRDLLLRCLEMDPEKRATPSELLQHPFIVQATTQKVMEDILRQIFLSKAFENSGMFI